MNNDLQQPLLKKRLFFLLITGIIQVMSGIILYLDLKYALLFAVDLLFYCCLAFRFKQFFRTLCIGFLIFIINIQSGEGKIFFQWNFIRITEAGILLGLRRSLSLVSLLMITSVLHQSGFFQIIMSFIKNNPSSVFFRAIHYFFSLMTTFSSHKVKNIFLFFIKSRRLRAMPTEKSSDIKTIILVFYDIFKLMVFAFSLINKLV